MVVPLERLQVAMAGHSGKFQDVAQLFGHAGSGFVPSVVEVDIGQKHRIGLGAICLAVLDVLHLRSLHSPREALPQSQSSRWEHAARRLVFCRK